MRSGHGMEKIGSWIWINKHVPDPQHWTEKMAYRANFSVWHIFFSTEGSEGTPARTLLFKQWTEKKFSRTWEQKLNKSFVNKHFNC
jgi:hypothetical protein